MEIKEHRISPSEVLQITNILRSLGLNTSYIGTKLLTNPFNIL